MPKAKPEYTSGSMPQLLSTLGCTMPAPNISIQPVPLQTRQPAPLQAEQDTSTSTDGSVNGKKDGRNLTFVSLP